MTFVRIIPGEDALLNGLLFPGDTGLRLATNGSTSGLSAAGSYFEAGLSFWMASGLVRATLLDLGSIWVGFHEDMDGAGPSLGVAVTDGLGNHYSARFAADPRSSDSTRHTLEIEYAEGFGYEVFYDGEAVTFDETGGTDSGIAAYTDSIALGCDIEGNVALTRGSSVLGTDWDAASLDTATANELSGGVVWVAVGRSPGIWTLHMDMEGDFDDTSVGSTLVPSWLSDTGPVFDESSPALPPDADPPSSFGNLTPGALIGPMFTKLCTIREMVAAQDALGMGTQILGGTTESVPCSLQAMSTGRSMIYKAEGQTNVWDLYLPTRIENGSDLILPVGVQCVVDGVTYRSIGTGLVQGTGGVQMVPVERLAR